MNLGIYSSHRSSLVAPQLAHVRAEGGYLACGATLCPEIEKPATAVPGGPIGKNLMLMLLRVDPVGTLASLGLERFDFIASL